jgi:hypothetical protein
MLTVDEWVRERLENCQILAASEFGEIREGWLEDARYFQLILDLLPHRERDMRPSLAHDRAPVSN